MTLRRGITIALLMAGYGSALVLGEVKARDGAAPAGSLHRMLANTGWVCEVEVSYFGDGLFGHPSECRGGARNGAGDVRN